MSFREICILLSAENVFKHSRTEMFVVISRKMSEVVAALRRTKFDTEIAANSLLCRARMDLRRKTMFISFEGCEGVGKSTQLRLLKEYLESTHQSAVYVREPGSTDISEQIRRVILEPSNTAMSPLTEALLYAASRAQLVSEVIKPALEQGKLVICDRYVDSSVAYQGYGRKMGAELIKAINAPAIQGILPDVTVFIDLRPEKSFRGHPENDRLEQESLEFFDRVYDGFVSEIAASNGRIVPIKPEIDKKATSNKIINLLREKGAIK